MLCQFILSAFKIKYSRIVRKISSAIKSIFAFSKIRHALQLGRSRGEGAGAESKFLPGAGAAST
jgi:hypothetical protein